MFPRRSLSVLAQVVFLQAEFPGLCGPFGDGSFPLILLQTKNLVYAGCQGGQDAGKGKANV